MKKRLVLLVSAFILGQLTIPQAKAADAIVNGTFSSSGGGWTGASFSGSGNAACPGGQPNIGTWAANTLAFSYVKTTVYQDIVISKPSTLTLNYETQNRGDQVTTRWFSADFGTATTDNFVPSTTKTARTLTFTTTVPNQVVRVSFTGQDQLNWAGCYGTYVTNVSITVKPTSTEPVPFESYLQRDLVVMTKPSLTRFGHVYLCSAGTYGYRSIRSPGSVAEKTELDSVTLTLTVDNKIVGAASSDDFKSLPRWIFGLDSALVAARVADGSAIWVIPGTGSSNNVSCEVAAYKENQITFRSVRSS